MVHVVFRDIGARGRVKTCSQLTGIENFRAETAGSRSGDAHGAVCLVSLERSAIQRKAHSRVNHVINERFGMLLWTRVDCQ